MSDESVFTLEVLDKAVAAAKEASAKNPIEGLIFLYPSEINCWDLVCAVRSTYPRHRICKIGLIPR